VCLFGLLLINLLTVLANPCAGNIGVNFVPGNTCETYFTCVDNEAYPQSCPSGFFFDIVIQGCILAELADCTDLCRENPDLHFLPRLHAGCGAYYTCENGIGIPLYCENGLYFDPDQQICNHPDLVQCDLNPPIAPSTPPTAPTVVTTINTTPTTFEPGAFTCEDQPSGLFIPYPQNGCGGWLRCENGVGITSGTCDAGYFFDFARQLCNWEELVNCVL
jgi:hypothetical protein